MVVSFVDLVVDVVRVLWFRWITCACWSFFVFLLSLLVWPFVSRLSNRYKRATPPVPRKLRPPRARYGSLPYQRRDPLGTSHLRRGPSAPAAPDGGQGHVNPDFVAHTCRAALVARWLALRTARGPSAAHAEGRSRPSEVANERQSDTFPRAAAWLAWTRSVTTRGGSRSTDRHAPATRRSTQGPHGTGTHVGP